jgi:hypothetical protein
MYIRYSRYIIENIMSLDNESREHCPDSGDAESHSVNAKFIPLFEELLAIFVVALSLSELLDVHNDWRNPMFSYRRLGEHSE